jgi:hypothetical protein
LVPVNKLPESSPVRLKLVTAALRLVTISVAFGVLSGAVSIVTGLQHHSLGVFAIGLGVLHCPEATIISGVGLAVAAWTESCRRGQAGSTAGVGLARVSG